MSAQQYLFLFTIGPVQSFIAQARKTRDLYAGSAILGEIIESAIDKTMTLNARNKIIVPDPCRKAKPNRFLARIYADKPSEFGQKIERTARSKWNTIALRSFHDAGISNTLQRNGFNEEQGYKFDDETLVSLKPYGAKAQIDNILEIFWALIPVDESDVGYRRTHNDIQQWMAAIKNTRKFNQIDEPPARKCSLDGERNALYYRPLALNTSSQNKEVREKHIQNGIVLLTKKPLLDVGEGLSAVSLVKRYFAKGHDFPSTSRIALLNVIGGIEKSKQGEAFKAFFSDYGNIVNEQLYFEENITEEYFRKQGYHELVGKDFLPKIRGIQEEIARMVGDNKKKMSKYYALLVFDGDSMGSTWSGDTIAYPEKLEKFQANMSSNLQKFQEILAGRLGIFAEHASAYLDGKPEKISDSVRDDQAYKDYVSSRDDSLYREKGKCVYAGGDDFLGFVNLNSLFSVLKALREAYDFLVSKPLEDYLGSGRYLTFSAGVAVAHYKTPLKEVMRRAREMERKAKQIDEDKDAFAIAVIKHSGEIEEARYKWKVGTGWATDDFMVLIHELAAKRISNNFIKTFELEFKRLSDSDGNFSHSGFIDIELPRLIARSCSNDLSRYEREKEVEIVNSHVRQLYDGAFIYDPNTKQKSLKFKSLSVFLSALNICDFFKRETD